LLLSAINNKETEKRTKIWKEKPKASIDDLEKEGATIFVLDEKGEDIRKVEIPENPVFILGDHLGLPPKEMKRLKKTAVPISIGPKTYFASQVVAIVNNELDRREKN